MPEKIVLSQDLVAKLNALGLEVVRLSETPRERRHALLARYEEEVYGPAFPDSSIREDPAYWLGLLDAASYPPPPQPRIEVVLLVRADDSVVAGVTIEFYRTARAGLLTYISVAQGLRGQGIGRLLIAAARQVLGAMGGPEVAMFAETERLEDARDADEAAATRLRQRQLSGLGARWVRFDYVMPPLRPDSAPHRLHLMLFDPAGAAGSVPARLVAALIEELAAALSADLAANADTAGMMHALALAEALPIAPLPAGDRG